MLILQVFLSSGNVKESDEPAALCALHYFHKIDGKGYALVPEHVETRPLYSPVAPGIEQVCIHVFMNTQYLFTDTQIAIFDNIAYKNKIHIK